MGRGGGKLGTREGGGRGVWDGGKSSVLDGDVVGRAREEEGETVKGYFCSSDERCLASGAKYIKAGGGAEEGAVGAVVRSRKPFTYPCLLYASDAADEQRCCEYRTCTAT